MTISTRIVNCSGPTIGPVLDAHKHLKDYKTPCDNAHYKGGGAYYFPSTATDFSVIHRIFQSIAWSTIRLSGSSRDARENYTLKGERGNWIDTYFSHTAGTIKGYSGCATNPYLCTMALELIRTTYHSERYSINGPSFSC